MEPSGKLNILSSRSFFSDPQDTSVVYTGAREFEIKGDYLLIVKEDKDKPEPEHKRFFLTKTGERFVEATLNSLPSWIHSIFTSVRYNSLVNAKLNLFLEMLSIFALKVSKDGQILLRAPKHDRRDQL